MSIASFKVEVGRSFAAASVLAAALLTGVSGSARAQLLGPVHVSVAGGVALPAGGEPAGLQHAFHRQVAIDLLGASWPVGMQVEGTYVPFKDRVQVYPPCAFPGCTQKYYMTTPEDISGFALDMLVPLARGNSAVVPCLVGGIGVYERNFESWDHSSMADAGVNAGVEVMHPRSHLFAGVRGYFVNGGPRYVPIVAGLRF